jgi:diacylglycerol kinase family enzyme
MHFVGIFNQDGGTFRTMDMQAFAAQASAVFAAAGHALEARVIAGDDLIGVLAQVVADGRVEGLLVGGGDGTISAAADACFHSGKPLAVLPAGTMNLFARSLGVPLDLGEALAALASGTVRQVDIATANDRPFVHQFAVGIHTRLVRMREQLVYRSRMGKIIASGRAILRAVSQPPVFLADIETARGRERRSATGISVTNNPIGEGHVPFADRLDGGVLGVYLLRPLPPLALARFCIDVVVGHWKHTPEVSERAVSSVILSFPRRKRGAHALIDGELIDLPERVDLRIHPGALAVVAPLVVAADAVEPVAA